MARLEVIVIMFITSLAQSREQKWIDPHDMNNKPPQIIQPGLNADTDVQHSDCLSQGMSISHYKRLINLLLTAVTLDQPHNSFSNYKGHLHVNIPLESYKFLKKFTRSSAKEEDPAVLRKIDQILSQILVKKTTEHIVELFTTWTDYFYFTFYNRTTGILSACFFMLFISYKLLRANLTLWAIVKYLIFLCWVIDFAFTWINLLQEAEVNKLADSMKYNDMPANCDVNKMTTWQYVKYMLGSNDCMQYHHTVYKDYFWSIAPVTVLSHQFGILILTPASHIGRALGSFSSGILGSLPWGVNIILLPVLLIFSAIVTCIGLSFITRTSFSFNFLHLLQLTFGNEQRRNVGDMLSGQNLSALLYLAQNRNMIEDVRQIDALEEHTSASCNCKEIKNEKKTKTVENVALQEEADKSKEEEAQNFGEVCKDISVTS